MTSRTVRILAAVALLARAWPSRGDVEPLTPFRTLTIEGGIAASGTCIAYNGAGGPDGGTIDLTGIPPGATVIAAYLFWSVLYFDPTRPDGTVMLDGVAVNPSTLGQVSRTPCYAPFTATRTFRADVTSLVTGNGSHTLSGMSMNFTEGATLAAIYCLPGAPAVDVVIYDGIDVVDMGSTMHSQTIAGFNASASSPKATFLAVIGNGQNTGGTDDDPLTFNGTDLETLFGTQAVLSGDACPAATNSRGLWDVGLYDVSTLVPAGSTSASISLEAVIDCYSFMAYMLAVSTDDTPASCSGSPLCTTLPGKITGVKGVKVLPGDVSFVWDPDPLSGGGYRLYSVEAKTDLQLPAPWPNVRIRQCSGPPGQPGCVDPGALPPSPSLLFYQAVGVCGDGVSEGPGL